MLLARVFNTKLKEMTEDGILEVPDVVRLLHAELVNFSETLSFVTKTEKTDSRSLSEVLLTLSLNNRDGFFLHSLLLAPPAPQRVCHFLTEKCAKKSQRSRGLAQVRLNSVLLRDELRRLFSLLQVTLPIHSLVQLEKHLLEEVGGKAEILVGTRAENDE